MARQRGRRTPPTPAQRRSMLIAGAVLVFAACFIVIYETLTWENGNILALVIVALILFMVFVLPVITSLRHPRRGRM